MEPQKVEMETLIVKMMPLHVKMEHLNVKMEPLNVKMEPLNVKMQPSVPKRWPKDSSFEDFSAPKSGFLKADCLDLVFKNVFPARAGSIFL